MSRYWPVPGPVLARDDKGKNHYQRDDIPLLSPGSWPPNWLQGTPTTEKRGFAIDAMMLFNPVELQPVEMMGWEAKSKVLGKSKYALQFQIHSYYSFPHVLGNSFSSEGRHVGDH